MGLSQEEKERFLKALEEDWEFRNAVMGLLGIQELLKGMAELRSTQVEVLKVLTKLVERIDRLEERVGKLEEGMNRLESRVDRIDRTLENITMSVEVEANNMVQYYLRQRGISIKTGPVQFDSEYEFDIYGTNGQLTIVGEAKVRVGPAVIDGVVEKIKDAVKRFPDRFPGRVVIVVYCLRALQDAVDRARELGVWLMEDGNEVTPFPG
ncbi:hypothetical protein [Vulcanisaeta sp. JCM 14467]|uniref:hypothetical protein n=1 Tax=Vulcanisaeta sp. JCM 14467 TaxID=1295370 RepID=UPI0006D1F0BD|nr:hypothetical protein [Vulcanisaeta sp. JCM 14467]